MMDRHPATILLAAACLIGSVGGCSSTADAPEDAVSPQAWEAALAVNPVDAGVWGGLTYRSCSRLRVTWAALPAGYDRALLEITESDSGLSWTQFAEPGAISLDLVDLKAATHYDLSIQACASTDCTGGLAGGDAAGATAEEVWQLLGEGQGIDGLVNIVSDSNAKAHAFVYGNGAPSKLKGRIQLYYGALGGYGGSLSVATSNRTADPNDESSYYDFTSHVGVSGLIQPEGATSLVEWIGTGQAVPLSASVGGGIRLFFEARGVDGKTRIMSLDSQDGYVGQDFNADVATYCALAAHYEVGGGCYPKVEIGVDGDDRASATHIDNARQQKVGVRTLLDWTWAEDVGTFMVFTTGKVEGCSGSQKNHGYALWDGNAWTVQYDASGCPDLFKGVQAMVPLDVGQGRFKIQFGNPDETEGTLGGKLPFLGPKRLIYGDPARSGDPQQMEFEDWDSVENARDITFLWPDGSVLNATAEGYIDDFVLLTPTFDVEHQIQFVVLTDGKRTPFTSVAILRNR
jgi:hypothetical protein